MKTKMSPFSWFSTVVVLVSLLFLSLPVAGDSPSAPTQLYDYAWTDDFDQATLHPLWSWINEVPAQWSLTDNPGFLRIITSSGPLGEQNLLVQPAPSGDYQISTHLLFEPDQNFQFAGLVLYADQNNFLFFGRAYCDVAPPTCVGNGIYFDHIEDGAPSGSNFATGVAETGEAYLRVTKSGHDYTGYYSANGSDWTLIGTHTLDSEPHPSRVGLTAANDQAGAGLPADFDNFALDADLPSLGCAWTDGFDGLPLDSHWSWINEEPSQWSLTDRPGFLRIETDDGPVGAANLLVQAAPTGDYAIYADVEFTPDANYQIAGLVVYQDQDNILVLGRAFCDAGPPNCVGNGIYFDGIEGSNFLGNFATAVPEPDNAHLLVVREADTYSGYYSADGSAWTLIGRHTLVVSPDLPYVGLTSAQDIGLGGNQADFDLFELTEYCRVFLPIVHRNH
jgi:beta-xylosidase